MAETKDYFKISKLGLEKSYENLEGGDGYVIPTTDCPTAAIHPKADSRFIALLEFIHDVPRGNHYHKKKVEYLIVLRGKLKCVLAPADNSSSEERIMLTAGQQIQILPECIHTYTAIDGDALALEYSPQKYEADDVVTVD